MEQPLLDFRSDNTACVAPQLLDALYAANLGVSPSYGEDPWTARLQLCMSALFETSVRVFPVATGTAANGLSLAAACTSFGAVYCTPDAHIGISELNATGFFGGGIKVTAVHGPSNKLEAVSLAKALKEAGGWPHKSQPEAVNLVQATDLGEVYQVAEVCEITKVARAHDLKVHMDGARFANAVAHLGCTPAEITWKAGVDILSFGVTKNGGLLSDAIVVFSPDVAHPISLHLRRAGLVWSKMRYASAQLLAYLENDLWLKLALQANDAASRMAVGLREIPGARLAAAVQANEVFLEMPAPVLDYLRDAGVLFARRGGELARFVCRWDNTPEEVDGLITAVWDAAITAGGQPLRT